MKIKLITCPSRLSSSRIKYALFCASCHSLFKNTFSSITRWTKIYQNKTANKQNLHQNKKEKKNKPASDVNRGHGSKHSEQENRNPRPETRTGRPVRRCSGMHFLARYFRQQRVWDRETQRILIDFDCDWIVFERSILRSGGIGSSMRCLLNLNLKAKYWLAIFEEESCGIYFY